MLRDYEVTYILSTTLDEEAAAAVIEKVNQLIVSGGGSITEVHAWGRRHLAYPINHNRDGFYVTTRFAMPTQGMQAFETDLRLNENILRHGAFRQDEVPIKPILPVVQAAQAAPQTAPAALATDEQDESVTGVLDELLDPELIPAAED